MPAQSKNQLRSGADAASSATATEISSRTRVATSVKFERLPFRSRTAWRASFRSKTASPFAFLIFQSRRCFLLRRRSSAWRPLAPQTDCSATPPSLTPRFFVLSVCACPSAKRDRCFQGARLPLPLANRTDQAACSDESHTSPLPLSSSAFLLGITPLFPNRAPFR